MLPEAHCRKPELTEAELTNNDHISLRGDWSWCSNGNNNQPQCGVRTKPEIAGLTELNSVRKLLVLAPSVINHQILSYLYSSVSVQVLLFNFSFTVLSYPAPECCLW